MVKVLIASPLEPALVARIAAVDTSRVQVIYRPDLLGTPRYAADHFPPIRRTPEQSHEWARLLAGAEVMFDVDQPSVTDFVQHAPYVRWIQASSSGVGEWIRRLGLVDAAVIVTNAAGIHAQPLAEFVVFVMLRALTGQRPDHRWNQRIGGVKDERESGTAGNDHRS